MNIQNFEVIEVNEKFIRLKNGNIDKEIRINSNLKKLELEKGNFVEGIYNEFTDTITISKIVDLNSINSQNNSCKKNIDSGINLNKFSYPYNFVSLGNKEKVIRKKLEEIDRSLEKHSGRIKCTLTNLTPIFIGGYKEINEIGKHSTEYFSKVKVNNNENYGIPSSSLKGELRNIIEVLTTSCIKNVSNEKLYYRETSGKFGIIKEFPEESQDGLGTIIEAIRIKVYKDALPYKYQKEGFYTIDVNNDILQKYIEKAKKSNNKYKGIDPNSVKNKEDFNELVPNTDDCQKVSVLLWVSNKLKGNKKYAKILVKDKEAKEYKFSSKSYDEYKNLIEQRLKIEKEFYLGKEELKKGDGVVFQKALDEIEMVRFSFTELPKYNYKNTPYDLIPNDFKPCESKNLCPSCILFGTTGRNVGKQKERNPISRSGKLYISDAILEGTPILKEITLKPLGMPHPSLEGFYLKIGSYNDDLGQIRGRKFYWHHTDKINAKNYNDYIEKIKDKGKYDYNSTINFIEPKNKFHFEIVFKNLTDEELGVLIYALELEDGLLHKIGRAKAFGFGSSKIVIDSILLDNDKKYKSFIIEDRANEINKDFYVLEAKKKYKFDEKDEVKELKYILSANNILDFRKSPFPEDYRRKKSTNEKISQEETTLNWFLNKKERKELFLPTIFDYIKEDEKRKGKK
ncbi:TIGR03986 family CRISPR-associated RAMP protein [Fusobacterium nucleatum]|jgi:CRISPR-associated protein|uniref:TIGR03986 family type III CRISPR-associated RAMP protein n=1 Tax=Fusobacterium nucleatum subsp. polymorphum TaxID=76857 RepID=UPI001C6EAB20|nr:MULTISPECIES: TIGR03986 family CRISPR-associated RAMP protein [Fusobacterium]QYR60771.1 TIGR03986 family CRISPR-associated RAMP protein [Fusobacterium polymorphum]WCB31510.1 TIGR03986 family CRISPR-associated RAMP protein [Fusobacterium nucleatum]